MPSVTADITAELAVFDDEFAPIRNAARSSAPAEARDRVNPAWVTRSAIRALFTYSDARRMLEQLANGGWPDIEELEGLYEQLRAEMEDVGEVFDEVADVWVSPAAPEFDRQAASVFEGVSRAVVTLWACIEPSLREGHRPGHVPGVGLFLCCEIALDLTPALEQTGTVAAIRREARMIEVCRPSHIPGAVRFPEFLEIARDRVSAAIARRRTVEPAPRVLEQLPSVPQEPVTSLPPAPPGRPTNPDLPNHWKEAKQLHTELGSWDKAAREFNRRHGTTHAKSTVAGWGGYLRKQARKKKDGD